MTASTSSNPSSALPASNRGKVLFFVMLAATLLLGGGTYLLGALGAKMGHADTSVKPKRHRSLLHTTGSAPRLPDAELLCRLMSYQARAPRRRPMPARPRPCRVTIQ